MASSSSSSSSKASRGDDEEGEPIEMLVMDRNQLKERIMQNKQQQPSEKKKSARDLFFGKGGGASKSVNTKKATAVVEATQSDAVMGGAVARKRIIGGVMMDIPVDNADVVESEKRQKVSIPGGTTTKEKRKLNRLWRPSAEYKMVREGPVLSCHPDEHPHLQEHMMTIFKNTNPEVSFAEDPNTPLWIGVLKLDSRQFDQCDDAYYDPKLPHLKQMYAERPAKKFPADNMALPVDGGEPLPYWVDKFKLNKDKEKSQKQKSKNKKKQKLGDPVAPPPLPTPVPTSSQTNRIQQQQQQQQYLEEEEDDFLGTKGGAFSSVGGIPGVGLEAFSDPNDLAASTTAAAEIIHKDDDDDDEDEENEDEKEDDIAKPTPSQNSKRSRKSPQTASGGANRENLLVDGNGIPDFERYVFPLDGWMYTTTMMKGASKQTISKSSILKPSPAERLAKVGDQALKHIGRQGAEQEPAPLPPPPPVTPKPKPKSTPALLPPPPPSNLVPPSPQPPPQIVDRERGIPMLDIRLAKHSFVTAQLEVFKSNGAVNPLFHAYFSGGKGPDPTGLLTDFIDFLDKK